MLGNAWKCLRCWTFYLNIKFLIFCIVFTFTMIMSSEFDTQMYLYLSNGTSINTACSGGDDCSVSSYNCSKANAETFTVYSMEAGSYSIKLGAYEPSAAINTTWEVEVFCGNVNNDTSWNRRRLSSGYPSIGCNESLSDTLSADGYQYINFTLSEAQDVVLTNCQRYCTLEISENID